MNANKIRIQSVIYKNGSSDLRRTIAALDNAARVYLDGCYEANIKLVYGDASPNRILSESEVQNIKSSLRYISFDYVVFDHNTGSAAGHNLLAEGADCDFIMVMNPDVIVSPHIFENILAPFSDRTVGMVEARQTPLEHQKEYNRITLETEWATTACAMIRADIFKELDGFDSESFFLYCDDLDFSWRLRLERYRIIYQPKAPVYHSKKLSISGGWMPGDSEVYYSAYGSLMMAYKWSNDKQLEILRKTLKNGNYLQKSAVLKFDRDLAEGRVPERLDPKHQVSRFVGNYYTDNRFVL